MDDSLFRHQAVEGRRRRLLGDVILTVPVFSRQVVGLIGCLAVGLMLWVTLASYSRTAEVPGVVISSKAEAKVFPFRPGTIARLHVKTGETVEAGQRLASVSTEQHSSDLNGIAVDSLNSLLTQHEEAIAKQNAVAQLASAERRRLELTIATGKKALKSIIEQTALQSSLVTSLSATVKRMEPLLDHKYVSDLEVERRRQEIFMAKQHLVELNRASHDMRSSIAANITQLEVLPTQTRIQLAQTHIELEETNRQIAMARLDRSHVLVSPVAGQITFLQAAHGKAVDPRYPIAVIRPQGSEFEVELYAPSRSVGFLKQGQRVQIMYDAFPYKQFGTSSGTIAEISDSSIEPENLDAAIDVGEPVYKVRVQMDRQSVEAMGSEFLLHGGMTVRANVILARRTFLDWLLQPVNSIRMKN